MKTYKIIFETSGEEVYIRSDADTEVIENAILFIPDNDTQKLLQAIRIQGYKASEIKLEPEAVLRA